MVQASVYDGASVACPLYATPDPTLPLLDPAAGDVSGARAPAPARRGPPARLMTSPVPVLIAVQLEGAPKST
jgi:hypothetical protein